ncbi:hypothetical protein F5Y07DRAFT_364231 [Xylaria sp. FL0933]|nr:hypothetical protein F5Y07DRAFT_364231 [Xylaria sp. FL0933]
MLRLMISTAIVSIQRCAKTAEPDRDKICYNVRNTLCSLCPFPEYFVFGPQKQVVMWLSVSVRSKLPEYGVCTCGTNSFLVSLLGPSRRALLVGFPNRSWL